MEVFSLLDGAKQTRTETLKAWHVRTLKALALARDDESTIAACVRWLYWGGSENRPEYATLTAQIVTMVNREIQSMKASKVA